MDGQEKTCGIVYGFCVQWLVGARATQLVGRPAAQLVATLAQGSPARAAAACPWPRRGRAAGDAPACAYGASRTIE